MSLAQLLNGFDTGTNTDIWTHANDADHREIIFAIQRKFNVNLTPYVISPLPVYDKEGWLWRHQTMHNDMTSVTGVAGNDLGDVDFTQPQQVAAWMQLHFQEHQLVRLRLGI